MEDQARWEKIQASMAKRIDEEYSKGIYCNPTNNPYEWKKDTTAGGKGEWVKTPSTKTTVYRNPPAPRRTEPRSQDVSDLAIPSDGSVLLSKIFIYLL